MNRREILFRGKRVDNGERVEGHYCGTVNDGKYGLIGDTKTNGTAGWHVDIDTVSQFTGLTDSKGNKVFEGDIESSGGVVKLGIYEMFSDRSGFPTWIAERKNGASFVLVCDNEFKIRETIVGNIHDTHLTQQS